MLAAASNEDRKIKLDIGDKEGIIRNLIKLTREGEYILDTESERNVYDNEQTKSFYFIFPRLIISKGNTEITDGLIFRIPKNNTKQLYCQSNKGRSSKPMKTIQKLINNNDVSIDPLKNLLKEAITPSSETTSSTEEAFNQTRSLQDTNQQVNLEGETVYDVRKKAESIGRDILAKAKNSDFDLLYSQKHKNHILCFNKILIGHQYNDQNKTWNLKPRPIVIYYRPENRGDKKIFMPFFKENPGTNVYNTGAILKLIKSNYQVIVDAVERKINSGEHIPNWHD